MGRTLRHPPERVWPYLTDPRLLASWSPARAPTGRSARSGRPAPARRRAAAGRRRGAGRRPTARAGEPLGGRLLRWTLAPTAAACQLTLEHTFDQAVERGSYGAGWHLGLAVLAPPSTGRTSSVVGQRALDYGWRELNHRLRVRRSPPRRRDDRGQGRDAGPPAGRGGLRRVRGPGRDREVLVLARQRPSRARAAGRVDVGAVRVHGAGRREGGRAEPPDRRRVAGLRRRRRRSSGSSPPGRTGRPS